MRPAAIVTAAIAALVLGACGDDSGPAPVQGGDAGRGHDLIVDYGCGTCHTIGGVEDADATVGPDLRGFESNRYVAGELPNTPENAMRWIMGPQAIAPDTIMPDLGVSEQEAADIVTYLYSQ